MSDDLLQIVTAISGNSIRVTYRQWAHVMENHDYMSGNLDKVLETLAEPQQIIQGDGGELLALRPYERTNITRKTCVVVYRDMPNGFLITAFLTSKPEKIARKGKLIWSRSQMT